MAAAAANGSAVEEKQVLVRFTTKLPPELRVPATEVAVPASLKRYGLSQIINHLLALDPSRPFDFIVNGELVRRSLEQHLLEHSISPESVVEVEYVPAVIPPEPKLAVPQDDWVTCVAAAGGGQLLVSGAADGVVRLWDGAGNSLLEFPAHKLGVNTLAALGQQQQQQQQQHKQQQQQQQQQQLLLTGGKDHSLKLWEVEQQAASAGSTARCVVEYQGHKEAVQAVAASPSGSMCCSGGWDGQLLLWQTGPSVVKEAAAAAAATGGDTGDAAGDPAAAGKRKKQKTAQQAAGAPSAPLRLVPTAALPGHVHCVAAVAWPASDILYSGGWDHSVRRFDVEAAANTDTYNGSKAVYAVAAAAGEGGSGGSPDVVAFAGADRVLRLWDSRAVGEALAVRGHNAHDGWVSALAWRPGSGHQLASGGHDGAVKMWDIRTPVPLAALRQHADAAKVLAVGWAGPDALLSGGSDCTLQVYSLSQQAQQP